jgi:hypothetical protein
MNGASTSGQTSFDVLRFRTDDARYLPAPSLLLAASTLESGYTAVLPATYGVQVQTTDPLEEIFGRGRSAGIIQSGRAG